jgi:hypothetical protein
MDLSEKEIENYVFEDLVCNDGDELNERGLYLNSYKNGNKILWKQQLNIEPYGIIDIVGFYRSSGFVCVELIELKKVHIDTAHFEQILRYKKGLEVYLKNTFKSVYLEFHLTLIGSSYDGLYLQNSLPISVASFYYDLSGIWFDHKRGLSSWHVPSGVNKSFRKHG